MKMPQITLMDIIDRQRAKYERKVQEQMLLLAELAKETEWLTNLYDLSKTAEKIQCQEDSPLRHSQG